MKAWGILREIFAFLGMLSFFYLVLAIFFKRGK